MKKIEFENFIIYEIIRGEHGIRNTLTRPMIQEWKRIYGEEYEKAIKAQLLEYLERRRSR